MKPALLLLPFVLTAQASWFSSETPAYQSWDNTQLKTWLIEHNLYSPSLDSADKSTLQALVQANYDFTSSWTQEQYDTAQKTFQSIKDTAFDKWDESQLRSWLLEQGVVAPSGPKEQLVLLAKSRYNAYTAAASAYSSQASAAASSAMYGDTKHQASKSIESVAAQATTQVAKALDDSKDYIYSTWSDSELKAYLVEKGIMKSNAAKKRDDMLGMMKNSYASVTDPAWEAWSDSYMRQWLVDRDIISPSSPLTSRSDLSAYMRNYYYGANDYVWSTWSDSDLKQWLVDNGYVKSDAQIKRDKMAKMVSDTYSSATSTIVSAYSDSQLRAWAIEHGYLRSDAQIKRDDLVKLVSSKYGDAKAKVSKYVEKSTKTASKQYDKAAKDAKAKYQDSSAYVDEKYAESATEVDRLFEDARNSMKAGYLTWPDARLRAFLRQKGLSEDALPSERPGLLQETRIRWVQTTSRAEQMYGKIAELINGGVEVAEDKLYQVWEILSGKTEEGKKQAEGKYREGKKQAEGKYWEGREKTGEKVKQAGEKVKGEL